MLLYINNNSCSFVVSVSTVIFIQVILYVVCYLLYSECYNILMCMCFILRMPHNGDQELIINGSDEEDYEFLGGETREVWLQLLTVCMLIF